MRTFLIDENASKTVYCKVFTSEEEQDKYKSLCLFPVRKGQVLLELVEKDNKTKKIDLLGFRIYNVSDINIEDAIDMLKEDKYFDKRVDKKYYYVAD